MSFSKKLSRYLNLSEPHIGYAVSSAVKSKEKVEATVINGEYFDCGTPADYLQMLSKVLI
jgi:UTP-glucose-1-phosphate uridylyltransferase